jgi:hypothetical protein
MRARSPPFGTGVLTGGQLLPANDWPSKKPPETLPVDGEAFQTEETCGSGDSSKHKTQGITTAGSQQCASKAQVQNELLERYLQVTSEALRCSISCAAWVSIPRAANAPAACAPHPFVQHRFPSKMPYA